MAEPAPLDRAKIIRYYSRREIQEAMLYNCPGREVAVKYGESGFGKRPDTLTYPDDILEFAKDGATSFHASEEIWKNPRLLSLEQKKSDLEALRVGWDLMLDIDCHQFEYSKIAAMLVIDELRKAGVKKSLSIKFSGNKGFHIGVPFEAFPEKIGETPVKKLFPDAPRKIALYISEMMRPRLAEQILKHEHNNFSEIVRKTGKTGAEISEFGFHGPEGNWKTVSYEEYKKMVQAGKDVPSPRLNVNSFLEIDTILISSRHLYRMAYSVNEKSGLASVPVEPDRIALFQREDAALEKVNVSKFRFLERENAVSGEASNLFLKAFEWDFEKREKDGSKEKFGKKRDEHFFELTTSIPAEMFPPCIKLILAGLEDGKKRALFILINFLSSVGWDYEMIEKTLVEWNQRNREPLRENYLLGQLRYHRDNKKAILPPNCSNKMYYLDLAVCKPDALCARIRNPVNYAIIKYKAEQEESKKGKRARKKPEEKPKKAEKESKPDLIFLLLV
jgi:hypothetical protein